MLKKDMNLHFHEQCIAKIGRRLPFHAPILNIPRRGVVRWMLIDVTRSNVQSGELSAKCRHGGSVGAGGCLRCHHQHANALVLSAEP